MRNFEIAGLCKTMDESIIKVFEENILPYLRKFDSNDFRLNKLYIESCDKILRKHMQTFKDIYAKAARIETGHSEDAYMSISEFIDLITFSGVTDENFTNKEIGSMFNLSMMTQVDEVYDDRHLKMSFLEFVEAICRVADKVIFATHQGGGGLMSMLQKSKLSRDVSRAHSKGKDHRLSSGGTATD